MKGLIWVGPTEKELGGFPRDVQRDILGALTLARDGKKASAAKPLVGPKFSGAGVLEVVTPFDTNTYRAVYTVRFATAVYVLHVFQKKAKSGRKTTKQDIRLIEKRLKRAGEIEQEILSQRSAGTKTQQSTGAAKLRTEMNR